jgi:hypothetical protein
VKVRLVTMLLRRSMQLTLTPVCGALRINCMLQWANETADGNVVSANSRSEYEGANLAPAERQFQLTKNPPPVDMQMAFLMTDGSILTQAITAKYWFKYTPDSRGDYSDGKWTIAASLPNGYAPTYFASAVLADGDLAIIGGEYNFQ